MKGIRFLGNRKLEITDFPDPEVGKSEVLVKVKASAICGSELESFVLPTPLEGTPGHEVMGIVEDPNDSKRFKKGDRVGVANIQGCGNCYWCRQGKQIFCKNAKGLSNAHSEYVRSKEIWLHPVPDDIDNATAVMLSADGLGVPYGSAIHSGVVSGDITCVFGTGPVGQGMILLQTFLGAKVIGIDINPEALNLATQMGAWKTINPKETDDIRAEILEITDGIGPNKSFDACGNQEMFNVAMETTMPGGVVMTVAHGTHGIDSVRESLSFHNDPDTGELWGRNLCVMGNWVCYFSDYTNMLELTRNGLQIDRLITAQYPFKEAAEAYRTFEKKRGKTILKW
jgi:threonine dehydrogenase-like Zn-dependent dehydrogenase